MNTIIEWAKSKGGWAHICVVIYCSAITLYGAVPAFQTLCNYVWGFIPAMGHMVILAILGVAAFYKNTGTPQIKG